MPSQTPLPKQYFYTFPWLNGSSEILLEDMGLLSQSNEATSVVNMIKKLFTEFHNLDQVENDLEYRITEFLKQCAESKEKFTTSTDDIIHLAMYPLLQIILSLLGNRILGNAMANIYAKHCQEELRSHSTSKQHGSRNKYNDYQIQSICHNLGLECLVTPRNMIDHIIYPFQMDFQSYLSVATKLTGDRWKLINRIFVKGKVNLIRDDVILLLREMVRNKTKPDYKAIDPELKKKIEDIPEISQILERVEKIVEQNSKKFTSSLFIADEKIEYELFPPCMKMILFRASQGENLSHNERLAIAFYFLNTNHSIEETVDIFRTIPDFDESIARYQVEFAAGSRGKGKKYKMYNCAKLRSFRLCKADDPKFGDRLCIQGGKRKDGTFQPIKNPINDYVFWKKVELQRIHRSQIPTTLDGSKTSQTSQDSVSSVHSEKTKK
ncbi:MAG: hypothetical protein K9W44_06695 [Candidatus Lokiarchaeota archaeon]|nr:hypothetical protein [Candidatus Harpocratesius repetitus]